MSTDEEYDADRILMTHLVRLHEDHDQRHDVTARGKLANLRYGMRDRLHGEYPVGRVFSALAPGGLTDDSDRNEWRTLIAALFGFALSSLVWIVVVFATPAPVVMLDAAKLGARHVAERLPPNVLERIPEELKARIAG